MRLTVTEILIILLAVASALLILFIINRIRKKNQSSVRIIDTIKVIKDEEEPPSLVRIITNKQNQITPIRIIKDKATAKDDNTNNFDSLHDRIIRRIKPAEKIKTGTITSKQPIEDTFIEMGWEKNGFKFYGPIKASNQNYQGMFIKRGNRYNLFINNPPMQLLNGPKRHCFHKTLIEPDGGNWFLVTFNLPQSHPVSHLRALERLLKGVK